MRVLVAGGGGFVGGGMLRAIEGSVAGARRQVGTRETRVFDATDAAAVARALTGMDAVVNAVAGNAATLIAATDGLARAASRAGIPLIHISSMAVYGAATGLVDEDHPLAPTSRYGAAKVACERIVAAVPGNVILRPGIVYGPGSEPWIGRIARLLRAGRLGDLGAAGDGRCNLIHVDDVGAAAAAALRGTEGVFNLATPTPPRWNAFFWQLARGIGAVPLARLGPRRLGVEARVAPALQLGKLVAARCGVRRGWPDPVPRSLLALFAQDIALDPRRADTVLRFARTDDAAGLAAAARTA